MLRIQRIGIETELDVGNREDFLDRVGWSVGDTLRLDDGKNVGVDSEYYDNQVEFKTLGDWQLDDLGQFRDWITNAVVQESHHRPYCEGPAFVGTHIHLFLNHSRGPLLRPFHKGKAYLTSLLYREVAKFFREWIGYLPSDEEDYVSWHRTKNPFNKEPMKHELHRVLSSNNLSKYFDYTYMGGAFRKNLRDSGLSYQYSSIGDDRPKYQPLLWSLARDDGKPLSLEIRLFPNSYFLLKKPEDVKAFVLDTFIPEVNAIRDESDDAKLSAIETVSKMKLVKLHGALTETYVQLFFNGAKKANVLKLIDDAIASFDTFDADVESWMSVRETDGFDMSDFVPTGPSGAFFAVSAFVDGRQRGGDRNEPWEDVTYLHDALRDSLVVPITVTNGAGRPVTHSYVTLPSDYVPGSGVNSDGSTVSIPEEAPF